MTDKQTLKDLLKEKEEGCKEQIEKYDLILCCGAFIPSDFEKLKIYCDECQLKINLLKLAREAIENERKKVIKMIEEFKRRVMKNGNLAYRFVKDEEGELQYKRDYVLNNIVIEILEEVIKSQIGGKE